MAAPLANARHRALQRHSRSSAVQIRRLQAGTNTTAATCPWVDIGSNSVWAQSLVASSMTIAAAGKKTPNRSSHPLGGDGLCSATGSNVTLAVLICRLLIGLLHYELRVTRRRSVGGRPRARQSGARGDGNRRAPPAGRRRRSPATAFRSE